MRLCRIKVWDKSAIRTTGYGPGATGKQPNRPLLGLSDGLWDVGIGTRSGQGRIGEVMGDPITRFDRWRKGLPARTAKLVQKVVDELVPLYERASLQQHRNYAGADLRSIGSNRRLR